MGVRCWLWIVSLLVPRADRGTWREEWRAELFATAGGMGEAWGALADAWTLRAEGWTMEGMLRDVRMAVKGLARRPFFTALAGVTLAIGIGANTAIYSVVDAVLLDPLPFPGSDRILSVNHTAPGLNLAVVPHSEAMYLAYAEGFRALESFAVFDEDNVNLLGEGDPQRVAASKVTSRFFDVMGVRPLLGRAFASGEDLPGAEPLAVLGHGLWTRSFGADPSVVGRLVEMDGVRRRVIGVMPEGFEFPGDVELWTPLSIDPVEPELGSLSYMGVGRLAAGATIAGAQAEMEDLLQRIADDNPDELPRSVFEEAGLAPDVKPLKDLFVADVAQALWVLLGTVGFVLLIACANVANLFLVRAEARQREQALRSALGASRTDLVRHYLAESLSLAAGGGLLGLLLAWMGVRLLVGLAPVALPRLSEIGIDGSVLVFTGAISLVSGVLFGMFPVLGYARRDLSGALKDGSRSSTTGRERHRARSALIVGQVALALMLLVGSGLMARSFSALRSVDPGFDAGERLVFRITLPAAEYPDGARVGVLHRQLVERMAAVPGVHAAALGSAVPLQEHKNAGPMEAEDHPMGPGELAPLVNARYVSPGYLAALGIELVEGRELAWEDGPPGVRSLVVSETLARLYWPGESALGKRIRGQGSENPSWEVVGVARDVRFEKLDRDPEPLAYFPLVREAGTEPTRAFSVVLHTGSDPLRWAGAAREALREVDGRLPMVEPRTLLQIQREAMAATSFTVLLLAIAAAIALALGTVGIYGVISYVVGRRTQEIGVRMALGAPATAVLRQVVGQGMAMAGTGVAVGLVGAWGVSRVLGSLLYGVSATDPLTYAGTAALLAGVALLASWLPARRAARVDPTEALRSE